LFFKKRILKSLGELSYEHLKFPLLGFFAQEIYLNDQLPNQRTSMRQYWSESLRNPLDLEAMRVIIRRHEMHFANAVAPACTEVHCCCCV
jgi:hypothetical protein